MKPTIQMDYARDENKKTYNQWTIKYNMLDNGFLTIANYVYITLRDLQRKSYNIVRSTFLFQFYLFW